MKSLIGVYGAAGCGRGIMPIIRMSNPNSEYVFIDDGIKDEVVNGCSVLSWSSYLDAPFDNKAACIAVAASTIREKLANKCHASNVSIVGARASSVVEMDDVVIGEGACLSPFVTLTSNIRIGRLFHANLYSYVEHDCIVGDYVTLAPGAKVNGNVTLGDHVYIGSGAIIKQGIEIGAGAVVGMGAVVTRNVLPGTTVVGNPARQLNKG